MVVRNLTALVALMLVTGFCVPAVAFAYVGPGAGITAIGAVLAFVGGILMAILGFVWYPIRRVLRARAKAKAKARDAAGPIDRPVE